MVGMRCRVVFFVFVSIYWLAVFIKVRIPAHVAPFCIVGMLGMATCMAVWWMVRAMRRYTFAVLDYGRTTIVEVGPEGDW